MIDQKFEDQLAATLILDRGKIAELSDESLTTRITALREVLAGLSSPEESEEFKAAHAYIGQHPIDNYRAVLRVLRKESRRRATKPGGFVPKIVPWTPFERVFIDQAQFDTPEAWGRYEALAAKDPTRTAAQYRATYLTLMSDEHYTNARYHVVVRRNHTDDGEGGLLEMVHLSIKRVDQQTIHDWRDLQRIKNEIVGPECEGIELYPAESRCVDTANQYHLWVVRSNTYRWPVGFNEGTIKLDPEEGGPGIGQREFER